MSLLLPARGAAVRPFAARLTVVHVRCLSTTQSRFFTPNKGVKGPSPTGPGKVGKEETSVGSEGFHYKDDPIRTPRVADELKQTGVGHELGDWVLFHPVYSPKELHSVDVVRHTPQTFSDRFIRDLVSFTRKSFDWISGYTQKELTLEDEKLSVEELRKRRWILDEKAWLNRILFLESIAGVPGMVAATLRHLRSLRLMKRDGGWIHTLLEEAENERMHLMTFMAVKQPSLLFRTLVLGAQGVFYNLFFLSYLISPKLCHRFVGCLEEEAVITYTHAIKELEAGRLPEWDNVQAPKIAIDYWRLKPNATLLDVIYAVRSDESTHRFVNHSFANLSISDGNPFAVAEPDMTIKGKLPGFTRSQSENFVGEEKEHVAEAEKLLAKHVEERTPASHVQN
ncbi:mitochondrial alternative oxidase [Dacryopinax primogenitus]|uniref:Alternative oxidase n=1 Tax=Dacryopinax primogenitus (strain DJM 731) TaxID=1858805 RepID=M5FSR2_DACPD|nr:mitochondrial alternative oxidase [Dacryopinax primogenitus]EJU00531.1 mitochondrial alternative oxidase [Dacryopinax primogenitus]